jgi:predicted unusual protein kinase regulating ubiquinone biosynthesis (AarF/ABC1/UbiB family)
MQETRTSPLVLSSLADKAWHWYLIGKAAYKLKRATTVDEQLLAQQALSNALAEARGFAMKIGQFMAGLEDVGNPYQSLITSIESLPLSTILPTLEAQLGLPAAHVFSYFHPAVAAASLGQVHYAKLHDGTEVAVKVRYPGMVNAIKAELALSRWVPSVGSIKQWDVNLGDYKRTLHEQLLRETDYQAEMETQQRFWRNLEIAGLVVPKIYSRWCRDGVLVQSWEQGQRFAQVCQWSLQDRLEVGKILLLSVLRGLFVLGEVHADPHPGNYLFRHDENRNPQVVLLDFGCTVSIPWAKRMALLKLIDVCRITPNPNGHDILRCLVALGFDAQKLGHIKSELPTLCRLLLRPFCATRPFCMEQWQLSAGIKQLLGDRRWWFRSAGPAELFLLLRVFHGLSQQLEKLAIALPWWPLLQYVVGDKLLMYARDFELPTLESMPVKTVANNQASKLCVRLSERGIERIALDLPAEAALELETVIPGQVLLLLLANSGTHLNMLRQRLDSQGLVTQRLLDIMVEGKHCQLWLE